MAYWRYCRSKGGIEVEKEDKVIFNLGTAADTTLSTYTGVIESTLRTRQPEQYMALLGQ